MVIAVGWLLAVLQTFNAALVFYHAFIGTPQI